tara:strand:+ start:1157 stop:3247 length:2091 start_codon:yes stop_codon:yes gene_type:complete
MSLNIETTSDKPNFINYFSDPLTLPQNSQVVLTKTNLSVPIIVNPLVKMPNPTDTTTPACKVSIDGITQILTWDDIYNSTNYFFTNNFGLDQINDPATFFGIHEFTPNQQITIICANDADNAAGITDKMKVSFNTILAHAINENLDFYDVQSAPTYKKVESISLTNTNGNTITTPLESAPNVLIKGQLTDYNNDIMEELGFNIAYNPNAITASTPTTFNWSAADSLTNWTRTGADVLTSAVAGVNVAFATENASGFSIDPNGGWVGAVPALGGGGTMAYGLSFVSEFGGWDSNFLSGGGTTCDDYINLIDIGWKFKANDNGTTCAQVIDGKTDNASYTGAAPTLPQIPLTEPPHLVNIATAGEKFFIHIKRGAIVNGTTEFIFSLFSGTSPILESTDNLIYVCKRTFAGGNYKPTLVVLSDNILGNIFSSWSHIPITTQSKDQGDYFNSPTLYDGGTFNREFCIEPQYGDNTDNDDINDFWRAWGLISYENYVIAQAPGTTAPYGRRYFTNKTTGTHLLRTFKNRVNLQNTQLDVEYMIGQSDISKILGNNGFQLGLNANYMIVNLPSQLHVAIDNLDLKNFNGTLLGGAGALGTGAQTGQRPSVDRTIGTIPIPVDKIVQSGNYLLQYEPLNLIYRNINNPISFTINQLQVGIFYYDFLTNIRQNLEVIDGICNLELNIKQGYQPKKPQNNLLPY